jgi:hypothetical protein
MEGHPMLIDQQNQYCQNIYTTENNLYVQSNLCQNSSDIFQQDRKVYLKVHRKSKESQIAKANLSYKSNDGGVTKPDFILQSHGNKNSMVVAQKQT